MHTLIGAVVDFARKIFTEKCGDIADVPVLCYEEESAQQNSINFCDPSETILQSKLVDGDILVLVREHTQEELDAFEKAHTRRCTAFCYDYQRRKKWQHNQLLKQQSGKRRRRYPTKPLPTDAVVEAPLRTIVFCPTVSTYFQALLHSVTMRFRTQDFTTVFFFTLTRIMSLQRYRESCSC